MTYGCNNHPRRFVSAGFWVLNTHHYRSPPCVGPVWVRHRMSTDCRYDKSGADPGCTNCKEKRP